jgi:DNA (cytosine-5)-methyltransferase 1
MRAPNPNQLALLDEPSAAIRRRPPTLRAFHGSGGEELIVDNFAGGGGASLGIEWALGRSPDIAVNHDPEAVAMHAANHPSTRHLCGDVWDVNPRQVCGGRPVGLAWFSPDCTHHSKAKGGKPRDKGKAEKSRGLAWVVVRWARDVKPRVILLENVEEFAQWGPLDDEGRPDKTRRGLTFRRWVGELKAAGYAVESRELRAHDYGAPTIRKRLFVIARSDGLPIVWPEPTHGPGRAYPHRVAAECIQWELACRSIFGRDRPLADKTMARIARGVFRYVIGAAQPFIVPLTHGRVNDSAPHGVGAPLRTITGAHRGELALVAPMLTKFQQNSVGQPLDRPVDTVLAGAARFGLIAPTLVQTGYGERPGQAPRALDLYRPLGTVVPGGKHALVAAYLAKHYGGHEATGSDASAPLHTITTQDHHALVAGYLTKFYGTSTGSQLSVPMPTVTAGGDRGGGHMAEVRAFLTKYNRTGCGQDMGLPFATLTTKDRFGLVYVEGEPYAIADIGQRMLAPRELFRAQGFPDDYEIAPAVDGEPLTKTAQIRMCGNSVAPPVAAALVRANVHQLAVKVA